MNDSVFVRVSDRAYNSVNHEDQFLHNSVFILVH